LATRLWPLKKRRPDSAPGLKEGRRQGPSLVQTNNRIHGEVPHGSHRYG
jgi:hypothetical protein